jgi:predicted PurR-regulated permease PerM
MRTVGDRIEPIMMIGALLVLIVGCFLVLRPFLSALLWGTVLAYSTWPLYRALVEALGRRRTLAAALMTFLLALAFILPLVLVGTSAADGIARIIDIVRSLLAMGPPGPPRWLAGVPLIGGYLAGLWVEIVTNTQSLVDLLQPYVASIRAVAIQAGVGVGSGILEVTMSVLAAFFFYRDGESVVAQAQAIGRRVVGDRIEHFLEIVGGTVKSVVYGIVGTAIVQALLASIGYWVVGLQGAFVLGFVTFFLALLPMGPPLVWIPVTVWLFVQGSFGWAIFMGLWGTFVISGVDNFLKPWLISRGSDLSFLLVFLGVVGGALAFGFLGIFLGPVLLALGQAILREWGLGEQPPPPAGVAQSAAPEEPKPRCPVEGA